MVLALKHYSRGSRLPWRALAPAARASPLEATFRWLYTIWGHGSAASSRTSGRGASDGPDAGPPRDGVEGCFLRAGGIGREEGAGQDSGTASTSSEVPLASNDVGLIPAQGAPVGLGGTRIRSGYSPYAYKGYSPKSVCDISYNPVSTREKLGLRPSRELRPHHDIWEACINIPPAGCPKH